MPVEAMERCAYCGRDVPVTWVEIPSSSAETFCSGQIAICEGCRRSTQ